MTTAKATINMTGIIFNTKKECLALMQEIDQAFKFMYKGITSTYTHFIKHPEEEKYAVIIDLSDLKNLNPEIIKKLSKSVSDIVNLDSSWVKNDLDIEL